MLKNKVIPVLSIIILIILLSAIVESAQKGIEISKINNMYADIEILEDRIALYYLNNESIPIGNKIEEFHKNSINPNDNDNYYEIELNKLENLKLSYGYGKLGVKDKYIINEQSHTVYYYDGIELNNEKIYTKNAKYKYIYLEDYK